MSGPTGRWEALQAELSKLSEQARKERRAFITARQQELQPYLEESERLYVEELVLNGLENPHSYPQDYPNIVHMDEDEPPEGE